MKVGWGEVDEETFREQGVASLAVRKGSALLSRVDDSEEVV